MSSFAGVPWVAQWKFNNNGNGSIGIGNLTNNNSATFTTGILGGATGATQLVAASSQSWSIADNDVLSTGNIDFLLVTWVNATTLPSTIQYLVSKTNAVTADEYLIRYKGTGGTNRFQFVIGAANATVTASTLGAPSTGTWYCIVAWRDNTAHTININVNNTGTDSAADTTIAVTDGAFHIGSYEGTSSFWNGLCDMTALAKGAGSVPTAAIISALYNGGAGTELILQNDFAGTVTSAGALNKQAQKSFSGAASSAGALVRQANKALAGTMTSAGALTKQIQKNVSGAITPAGALAKQVRKSFSGGIASAGALAKQINKAYAGAVGLAGSLSALLPRFVKLTLRSRSNVATLQTRSTGMTLEDRTD